MMTPDDALLDSLAADLRPVRRRIAARDLTAFVVLAALEFLAYLLFRGARPDMPEAMTHMMFWWKAGSLALLAVIGVVTTIGALDPARSPRPGLRALALAAAGAVAVGWAIDAGSGGAGALLTRLDWREGLACVAAVVTLALPALGALVVLMRRGAATDPAGAAMAAGAAAAAWGGVVFTLHCPHDDPLYVALWFAVAIAAVMLIARAVVPRLIRW